MFTDELKSREIIKSDAELQPELDEHSEPYAIEFENVSRHYRLHHEAKLTLQDRVVNLFKKKDNYEDFWALKNVSFKLEKGKTLGIIGPNGAGKSTLLKLATRILEPTSGTIRVNGRVSAMLELGTGFHPELSARDNIYLNGAFYGFNRQQMDERYERIVEFSELGKFIDTPVKHYSSGMYMRLGFAVAITVSPDILIIDEVLAVGDAAFGRKCHRAIEDLKNQSKAMLFVSHSPGEVSSFCDEVIYLNKGELVGQGKPGDVLDQYMMSSMGPTYFISKDRVREHTQTDKTYNQNTAPATPQKRLPNNSLKHASPEQVSVEESLLKVEFNHHNYFQISAGISQPVSNWQFNLGASYSESDLKDAEWRENQYYLAVLNPTNGLCSFELTGHKKPGNLYDQTIGVMRRVPMGQVELQPEQMILVKLEQGAIMDTSLLTLSASTPVVAELITYQPFPRHSQAMALSSSIIPSTYWFFPWCDIRRSNACRLEIFNASSESAEVKLTLYRDWTTPVYHLRTYEVMPFSKLSVDLNKELAGGDGERYAGERFCGSVMLESSTPVTIARYNQQVDEP